MPFCRCNRLSRSFFLIIFPILPLFFSVGAQAQSKVAYEISFPNAVHHEAEITVTFSGIPIGKPLEARMSRSSPGRYAMHEFAKNVYSVKAFDGKGTPLTLTHPNPYQWNVAGHRGVVKITYTVFADYASGTYSGVDNTHAHLNMPATFMWARGFDNAPIRIVFKPFTSDWKVGTQLVPTDDPYTFTAPHMQYFMDSITEVSNFKLREWSMDWHGKKYNYRLVIHDNAGDKEVDDFVEMLKKVVPEEAAVFGEPANYDYGTYTFIACYMPYVYGDGMEHRNSTSLTATRSIAGNGARGNLSTAAHEFFHSWNVKRIRPKTLEPFDYENADMSGELWPAEGFTNYYGPLALRRAGFSTDEAFARQMGFPVSNVINSPGRQFFSPVGMSRQSVFADGGVSTDTTNRQNTFISYYTWGSVVALGLDLTLRSRFHNITLDDYMHTLWETYGKFQTNGRVMKPYTLIDLRAALAKTTGDQKFAEDFFRQYIDGTDVPDFASLLTQAGFSLQKQRPGKVWLDANLHDQDGGGVVVFTPTLIGGPLYKAGLDHGDRITAMDGQAVSKVVDAQKIIDAHKPGDAIKIEFTQRGEKKVSSLVFTEDPQLEVVTYESAGKPLTDAMKKFRQDWLESHVKSDR